MRTTLPEPGACFWCDLPARGHMQRWTGPGGWHQWTPPTDRMRLDRMRARRAERLTRKAAAA